MAQPITIRTLLEAGVHFGHQTRRWNPKMEPYIFGERGGIYILDLKRSLLELDSAYSFVRDLTAKGGTLLFVGTKKQAQGAVESAATRCGMPYVSQRWLGGMLTNFVTMRSRINRLEEIERMEESGQMALLPKKEQILLGKEHAKLERNLGGIRDMRRTPQALFVVDTKREEIAIREARRLGIPVVALLDTNSDPDEADYGIPANDDAIRSIELMCNIMSDAVLAGTGKEPITAEEMTGSDIEQTTEAAVENAPVVAAETTIETPAAE